MKSTVVLDRENLIKKSNKKFKYYWINEEVLAEDEGPSTYTHKLTVTFNNTDNISKNLTLFDKMYLLGKNNHLMSLIFGYEDCKNWYESIYESELADESETSKQIAQRIKLLDFTTDSLHHYVSHRTKNEIMEEISSFSPYLEQYKIDFVLKTTKNEVDPSPSGPQKRLLHDESCQSSFIEYAEIETKYLQSLEETVEHLIKSAKLIDNSKILRGKMNDAKYSNSSATNPILPNEFFVNQGVLKKTISA